MWLQEARCVLRTGGTLIVLQSLGTGNAEPRRPPHMETFYEWLDEKEFSNKSIHTDYRFVTPEMVDELVGFFLGEEARRRIKRENGATLAECTGVWWMTPSNQDGL